MRHAHFDDAGTLLYLSRGDAAGGIPLSDAIPDDARLRLVDGEVIAEPAPEPSLAERRAVAKRQVDAAAESHRLRVVTPGAAQALVYELKRTEAVRWKAIADGGGTPVPAEYPLLAAEIGITADDLAGVAAIVLALAAAWSQIAAGIETTRLGAKRGIDQAPDAAAIDAILAGLAWPEIG